MYYRRKILLSLFEVIGNELEKIRLQKLLMLLSVEQEISTFDFVPYKYGGFSFRANADLYTMTKYNQIEEKDKTWVRIEPKTFFLELKEKDQLALRKLASDFGHLSTTKLLDFTYKKYPYFAINSTILEKVVKGKDLKKVQQLIPKGREKGLFTIGYEGVSLETYLNKLIKNGVKALIDVRKNSRSMKYGFNKKQLKNACEGINIAFFHFSDLGIESNKRRQLVSQIDYDTLFMEYSTSTLSNTMDTQLEIIDLILKYNRVALTCFEADICQCHRKPLAESIVKIPKYNLNLIHI